MKIYKITVEDDSETELIEKREREAEEKAKKIKEKYKGKLTLAYHVQALAKKVGHKGLLLSPDTNHRPILDATAFNQALQKCEFGGGIEAQGTWCGNKEKISYYIPNGTLEEGKKLAKALCQLSFIYFVTDGKTLTAQAYSCEDKGNNSTYEDFKLVPGTDGTTHEVITGDPAISQKSYTILKDNGFKFSFALYGEKLSDMYRKEDTNMKKEDSYDVYWVEQDHDFDGLIDGEHKSKSFSMKKDAVSFYKKHCHDLNKVGWSLENEKLGKVVGLREPVFDSFYGKKTMEDSSDDYYQFSEEDSYNFNNSLITDSEDRENELISIIADFIKENKSDESADDYLSDLLMQHPNYFYFDWKGSEYRLSHEFLLWNYSDIVEESEEK